MFTAVDKSNLITTILTHAGEKDRQMFHETLTELVQRNASFGMPEQGFLYRGQFHTHLNANDVRREKFERRLPHPQVMPAIDTYLRELERFEREMSRIEHGLSSLLRNCRSGQDIRDALPEYALQPIMDDERIKDLPRCRAAGWPFESNPLLAFQYEETDKLLGFYFTNRMLF